MNDVIENTAKMLNIEIDQPFKIANVDGNYRLTKNGLINDLLVSEPSEIILLKLMTGEYDIVRNNRYRPTFGNIYWYVDNTNDAIKKIWVNDTIDYALFALGNVYRTREEGRKSNVYRDLSRVVKAGRDILKESLHNG